MRKRTCIKAALLSLTFAGAFGTAHAQTGAGGNAAQMKEEFIKRFHAADTNGDGKLTREEAKAGMPMVYKHFDEFDVDKKGYITMQDIAARAAARRKAKEGSDAQ